MSPQRRSMTAVLKTDELSEKEKAFIRGESVKGAVQEASSESFMNDAAPATQTTERSESISPKSSGKGNLRVVPTMVGLSTRIPADLHEKLMRVSLERRIERREPCTHQDIITEAISAWLKKAGNS